MKPLNPYIFDLDKAALIEASAGTGKTYTITTLVVRLIALGFPIESVLVVTFTEAAAAELKLRIRRRLAQVFHAMDNREPEPGTSNARVSEDELIQYLSRMPDPGRVRRRIFHSLICFDQAAVMTIHSFCLKTLRENAFESGAFFDVQLVPDASSFLNQVCMDFFMIRINDMDPLDLGFLAQKGVSPEGFFRDFRSVVSRGIRDILPSEAAWQDVAGAYRSLAGKIRDLLEREEERIIALIRGHKGLDQRSYPSKKVSFWLGQVLSKFREQGRNALFVMEETADALYKFTASRIAVKTKAGFSPPCHEFFDQCEELAGLYRIMEQNRVALRWEFLEFFDRELKKIKENQGILFFDDVVEDLAKALEGPGAKVLRSAVRAKYRACLIDEFQDTDSRQYGIFSCLFTGAMPGEPDFPFFMIGDPKQAIYAFRGGDIFAYLAAGKDCSRRFTLEKNFRSSPLLVQAINQLFGLVPCPFLFEDIGFTPVGTPETAVNRLKEQGNEVPPLRFSFIAREGRSLDRQGYVKREDGANMIPKLLARQVISDLRSGFRIVDGQGGERSLVPGDMAVLVRTNVQAEQVREALSQLNIPAYVSKTGSVFDSGEANELFTVLTAAARSARGGIKAALATSIFGFQARDLGKLDQEDGEWEIWQERFRTFRDLWETRGVAAMFMTLFHSAEGVLRPDCRISERSLTNFYHLIELSSQAEQQGHLSSFSLLDWLETQLFADTRKETADELRLESDKQAVAIVTIHKSKGLEYPVVYLPYLWMGAGLGPGKGPILFHDPERGNRLRLDLRSGIVSGPDLSGSDPPLRSMQLKEREEAAEQRRLLYVALTRASAMCRIFWGGFSGVEASALGSLLHSQGCGRDEDMQKDIQRLPGMGKSLSMDPVLDLPPPVWVPESRTSAGLAPRILTRRIETAWSLSSFSGMISSGRADSGAFPSDALGADNLREAGLLSDPGMDTDRPIVLADFPKGAHAGDFFHSVLENLDFGETDSRIAACVTETLERFGFQDPGLLAPACRAVRAVLDTGLGPANFCLKDIPATDRITELEFVFETGMFRLSDMAGLFEKEDRFSDYAPRLRQLGAESFTGFVKGFIDLVVRFQGRWYIIDYKSNFLGDRYICYQRSAMEAAMADHHYILQYHIYLAALDRFLGLRLPGYAYGKDFGGVLYLFIRGMHPDFKEGGIFYDRPPETRMRRLRSCLRTVP